MLCELIVPHYAECFSACMSRRGKEQHITLFGDRSVTGALEDWNFIAISRKALKRFGMWG